MVYPCPMVYSERGSDLLTPMETFEHYENRSRPPSVIGGGQWATDTRTPQPPIRYTSNQRQQSYDRGYNQGVRSAISSRGHHTSHTNQTTTQNNMNNGQLACEYRADPIQPRTPVHQVRGGNGYGSDSRGGQGTTGYEYRDDQRLTTPLRGGYDPRQSQPGTLACEYRDPSPSIRTTTTTVYQPQTKKKLPLRWILCISITVPIFVIVCLFGAVQLQELGIL